MRRRFDNDFPCGRPSPFPPGAYDLYVLQQGMTDPLPVGEGIVVDKGKTVVFDAGL